MTADEKTSRDHSNPDGFETLDGYRTVELKGREFAGRDEEPGTTPQEQASVMLVRA